MNILSHLLDRVEDHPDKIAFSFFDEKFNEYNCITFKELNEKSNRAAILLENRGFRRGMKIIVIIRPSIELITVIYAMFKVGIIPIFLPNLALKNRTGRKELRLIISRAKIDGFIGDRKYLLLSWLLGIRKFSNKVIPIHKLKKYFNNSNNESDYSINTDLDWSEESAFVKYTTGSTGPAKGVIYNHAMLHSHIEILKSEGINSNDVFFGRSGTLIVHPMIGLTSVVHTKKPKDTTGEEIVKAINRWGVTTSFLSPPSAINLSNYLGKLNNGDTKIQKFTTLNKLFVGGETVPPEVVENIQSHFSALNLENSGYYLVYGATEGFPLCQNSARGIIDTEEKTNLGQGICLGEPVGDAKIRILTYRDSSGFFDNSTSINVPGYGLNSIGEISVSGSVVYSRLIGDDEIIFGGTNNWAFDKNDNSYWHRTGDLGYIDENKKIWLVGRKKHIVELKNGVILYPRIIEPILDSMFGIRTALVNIQENSKANIIIEKNEFDWELLQKKLISSIPNLCDLIGFEIDFSFILYDDYFPVDSGHQAKIRREILSQWLCE